MIPFLIAGVGNSLALPCVATAALNAVPPPSLSKAAGILNTLQQLGAVFGIAVATAVFNAHGSLTSPAAISHGFRPALAVSATASILGALAALAIRPHPGMGLSGGK